jgi:hypothetical protein
MQSFPMEFADLLNKRGQRLLDHPPRLEAFHSARTTPIVVFDDFIEPATARRCIELLDRSFFPMLRRMETPVAREWLTKMKKNYSEALQKTLRVKTATFNSRRSLVLDSARAIGLAQMMGSASFRRFAEAVVGAPLMKTGWGRQVICYEQGDYSGPHNDHHPESDGSRNGFVDLHVMFSNEAVRSQQLVYENRGFLSASHDVSGRSGIAVYRLPFWHYTTPLIGRSGRESEARRWLLLGSFDFDPPPEKLRY